MKARQHARGNEHSIFLRVLIPLMALVAIEVVIMLCTVALTNVAADSSQNTRDIVSGKLAARATYLQSTMANDWMNIGQYVDRSNKIVEEQIESGDIREDELRAGQCRQRCPARQAVADDAQHDARELLDRRLPRPQHPRPRRDEPKRAAAQPARSLPPRPRPPLKACGQRLRHPHRALPRHGRREARHHDGPRVELAL